MPTQNTDEARQLATDRFVQRITECRVGDLVPLGSSWLARRAVEGGEMYAVVPATSLHLLYRNRGELWPGFYATGAYRDEKTIVVFARDSVFDPSGAFRFFEQVSTAVEAQRFSPQVRSYPGFALYEVVYGV